MREVNENVYLIPLLPLAILTSWQTRIAKKTTSTTPPVLSFPDETSHILSPQYPAFRRTLSLQSPKLFSIDLNEYTKPHIIFVFLESFRAKNTGALGRNIKASPYFDQWSQKGILYKNFHTTGLQTYRSIISTYFGIPANLPSLSLHPYLGIPMVGLPEILKNQGYHNAIIQSGDLSFDSLHTFFSQHQFDTIIGAEEIGKNIKRNTSWGIDDEHSFKHAANFLKNANTPTFLSLFSISNHHPWKAPKNWHFPNTYNTSPPYTQFLQTFSYTDYCLNQFLSSLEDSKMLEKSIVFIFGDHGQEMEERGSFSEFKTTLFEENIHVPLLILSNSTMKNPKICNSPTSPIDILPTILDILKIKDFHHSLGHSLLREKQRTIYFSLPSNFPQIGSLTNENIKTLIDKDEILVFNLKNDPDEINPQKSSLTPSAHNCINFFKNIQSLYKNKAWVPKAFSHLAPELKTTAQQSPNEVIALINQNMELSDLNLSETITLSDFDFLKIDPKKSKIWRNLNLQNNIRISDKTLEWISKNCPSLSSLNLSHCHLITDMGLATILNNIPSLTHLSIEGLTDIKNFLPKSPSFPFLTINLEGATRVTPETVTELFNRSENLISFKTSLNQLSSDDFSKFKNDHKNVTHLSFTDGNQISNIAFERFLHFQTNLRELNLEDFPLLENLDFSKMKNLKSLEIKNLDNLRVESLGTLKNTNILKIQIENCSHIFYDEIINIFANSKVQILIR